MKLRFSTLIQLFFLSAMLASCGSKKKTSPAAGPLKVACNELTVIAQANPKPEWSPSRIIAYKVLSKNCIALHYQYSGCHPGEPLWLWNRDTTRDKEVLLHPQLFLTNAGFCEMLIDERDTFNLSSARQLAGNAAFEFTIQGDTLAWPLSLKN